MDVRWIKLKPWIIMGRSQDFKIKGFIYIFRRKSNNIIDFVKMKEIYDKEKNCLIFSQTKYGCPSLLLFEKSIYGSFFTHGLLYDYQN